MNCGRKFNENAHRIHIKSCTSNNPSKGVKGKELPSKTQGGNMAMKNSSPTKLSAPTNKVKKEPSPSRPRALMCYICGREFGTKSLGIHIKTCIKKWEDEEIKKPKANRRPVPQPPPILFDILEKDNLTWDDINEYNSMANNKYTYEALIKCPNCGRTFTDTSFKSHQKSCTSEKPAKGVGNAGNSKSSTNDQYTASTKGYQIEDNYEEVERDECAVCGRKFAVDRLEKHQKVCKKAKVKEASRPKPQEKPKPAKKEPIASNKWREQHQEFVESMKYNRQVKKMEEKGLPISNLKPPKRTVDSSLILCPTCGRRFNEKAAERHIPLCPTIINKPKSVAENVGKHKPFVGSNAKSKNEERKSNIRGKPY